MIEQWINHQVCVVPLIVNRNEIIWFVPIYRVYQSNSKNIYNSYNHFQYKCPNLFHGHLKILLSVTSTITEAFIFIGVYSNVKRTKWRLKSKQKSKRQLRQNRKRMKRKVQIVGIIGKLELIVIMFVFNFFYVRFENNYSIKIRIFIYFLLK